jgi:hypothetical protein
VAAKPVPVTHAPATTITSYVPLPASENTPYKSRGPHIANVKMMTPSEREEFEASLKSKTRAS